jgi:TPR repeat protein
MKDPAYRLKTIAAASSLILILCSGAVIAETNEDGTEAISRGDYAQANKIFRELADKGDATAQFNLGAMYSNGQGTAKDFGEAIKWYRSAAAQGHAGAQSSLGYMYYLGQGVAQDNVRAHMWFSLAATKGSGIAQKLRDKLAPFMSPAQIAESQRMATGCENSNYKECD